MINEIIKNEIRTCGKSRYQISKDTGIDQAALCRIMQGGGCRVETVEILCQYFDLEIIIRKRKTRKKVKK